VNSSNCANEDQLWGSRMLEVKDISAECMNSNYPLVSIDQLSSSRVHYPQPRLESCNAEALKPKVRGRARCKR
jgi:hypothetical protein